MYAKWGKGVRTDTDREARCRQRQRSRKKRISKKGKTIFNTMFNHFFLRAKHLVTSCLPKAKLINPYVKQTPLSSVTHLNLNKCMVVAEL